MGNYNVGRGKPPKHTQFKPGESGNPKGRPKRTPSPLAELIQDMLQAPVRYREHGQVKVATRYELSLKMLVDRAVAGDVRAAVAVLRAVERAEREGGGGILLIEDWLPDIPGQTAAQKSKAIRELSDVPREDLSDMDE